jgi:hypothetical protein
MLVRNLLEKMLLNYREEEEGNIKGRRVFRRYGASMRSGQNWLQRHSEGRV